MRFAAITPPNAETGIALVGAQVCAGDRSSAFGAATAMPQGFACLMIATAGLTKSKAARSAASAST